MAIIDIWKLDENGKLAEHWDVLQEIPEEALNQNGMFWRGCPQVPEPSPEPADRGETHVQRGGGVDSSVTAVRRSGAGLCRRPPM
ncbi:MAG TPA: hypothetical protein VFA45_05830, partial [Actinomycetes bacterium]|nr:hypothetical protein [Actinomycetes bacterium]